MLKFDRQELVPAVILDDASGEVLMVAFMNEEAFQRTRETGYTHFFSRSRNALWRKGEQSGNVQEVRDILINCEENSLLIRVVQHGDAACHDGYRSCYYRRLLADGTYQTIAERIFDPVQVYGKAQSSVSSPNEKIPIAIDSNTQEQTVLLENALKKLYGAYAYLRDHDLSEESNTSRLLQEKSQSYLVSRLADELQELADVQAGIHYHSGQQDDTVLEGSQVGYWLLLLATTCYIPFDSFTPHAALHEGYTGQYNDGKVIEMRQECLTLLATDEADTIAQGLRIGFMLIGWACATANVSPLAPVEFDLDQMRRKGLIE